MFFISHKLMKHWQYKVDIIMKLLFIFDDNISRKQVLEHPVVRANG